MTEEDILALVSSDEWMMEVLEAARSLDLPEWMIGAGFVRNRVWDHVQKSEERHLGEDIDLVYFDPITIDEAVEKAYEAKLRTMLPANWSVKNEARMHVVNGDKPYVSAEDAIAHWPETATCVAVTLDEKGGLRLVAPHGIDDLVCLRARPSPLVKYDVYKRRMSKKGWKSMWPDLDIEGL